MTRSRTDTSRPFQVAQGSVVEDSDGRRQVTVLFPAGTTAEITRPDGSKAQLTQLDFRATEYTVGESGPAAMPAPLPPTSAYTYAVELSAGDAPPDAIWQPEIADAEYLDAVADIRRVLAAGTCYQVNYTQRLRAVFGGDPWAWFRAAARGATAGAYLDLGRHVLALGLPPGPRIGEITRAVYDLQLDGSIATLDEAIAAARRNLPSS